MAEEFNYKFDNPKAAFAEAEKRIETARREKATALDLSCLGLTAVPKSLGQLTALQELDLYNNQLTSVPESLGQLKALQELFLFNNQLTSVPESLGQLKALKWLSLSNNQLTSVPESLGQLKALQELFLFNNQLTSVPESLGQLTALQRLDLFNNQLTSVPESLGLIEKLRRLDFQGNPALRFPPSDIAELDAVAPIRYLQAVREGEATVWESKALLVGEGSVGKTWLYEALNGRFQGGNRKADTGTVGIEIGLLPLEHPRKAGVTMCLNCWDFSGQAVNHATHQFFFSRRSLFILCWSARAGWEAGRLRRWLNNIRDRAPGASVLLVATQWDAPHADYPEKDLLRDYPQIVRAHRVSSTTGEGIARLKQDIATVAADLPLMGLRWPASWHRATAAVEQLRLRSRRHASITEVREVMAKEGLTKEDAAVLLRWLHELGEVLHFADAPELAELVMLDPQWVTKRVGEVLASRDVETAKGILTRDCLAGLWPNLDDHIRQHLLGMMDEFDLAYRIPEDSQERSIVVEKLPQNEPDYEPVWKGFAAQREVRLRFQLKAMHPGIPTWLIARCHRFTQNLNWLRGAVFGDHRKSPQHLALVQAYDDKRVVDFAVRGPFPPTLMTLLVDGFLDTVQRRYPGLEMERLVPCPGPGSCKECKHYFKQVNLENRLTGKPPKLKIECEECGTEHEIAQLLFGLSLLPAVEAITAEEVKRVVTAEGETTRAHFDQGLAAVKEFVQLQFIKEWNTQQLIERQSCPTVFSLYSLDGGTIFRTEKLRLQLYCMKPGCWHPIGEKGRRDFAPPKEWAQGTIRFLRSFATMLRPATIAAAAIANPALAAAVAGTSVADMDQVRKQLDATAKLLADWEKLSLGHDRPMDSLVSDSRAPSLHEAVELEDLKKFLETLFPPEKPDAPPGYGLERVRTPEDHVLWLCPEHAKEYR
jgi:internalin A